MISILVPTRGRPEGLLTALNSLGLRRNRLEALVWVDDDDPELERYKELFQNRSVIKLFIKKRVGYNNFQEMMNFLAEQAKFDWYFFFNDDAYMDNPNWFKIFKNYVREFEPAIQPVVINIWGQGEKANLFPIVSRAYCDVTGHFSLSVACDDWIRIVSMGAGINYNLNGIRPHHRKYFGDDILKDQTHDEVEALRVESKGTWDPRRGPNGHELRNDVKKLVRYNLTTAPCENCQMIKTVGFIGLGKLGLPVAEAIAARGYKVVGYDIKPVETSLPLADSLEDLVKQSDLVFCAVQTPHDPLYEGDKPLPSTRSDFDYSYLIQAIKDIVAADPDKVTNLVVVSTCLPGTFKTEIKPLLTNKINYIYNPFFIAMGTVVEDFLNPEFVLIGGDDPIILKHFYAKIHGRDRTFVTDITTAEGIKVFYNTYVTTKTVLGNMYGEFAHKIGMNVDHIYEALSRATDRLISPKYLKSGMADGGSCHPRDNIALSHLANKVGLSFNYFDSLMTAREKHTEWLAKLFTEKIKATGLRGIILGKSFKPESDITTGSAASLLAHAVKQQDVSFEHYEFDYPEKLPIGVFFIATQHDVYRTLAYPTGSVIIDPFRYIEPQAEVTTIGIGNAAT